MTRAAYLLRAAASALVLLVGAWLSYHVWSGVHTGGGQNGQHFVRNAGAVLLALAVFGIAVVTAFFVFAALTVFTSAAENHDAGKAAAMAEVRDRLVATCVTATQQYSSLPELLHQAIQWYAVARQRFADGAFSPFWEAIEQAYQCLANYDAAIGRIRAAASEYSAARDAVTAHAGGTIPFPLTGTELEALQPPTRHVDALASLVYQAQQQPVFAQIWEQRRTTAATIAGFANLEDAVHRMRHDLTTQIASLEMAVRDVGDQIITAVDHNTAVVQDTAREQLRATNLSTAVTWLTASGASQRQLQAITTMDTTIATATRDLLALR